MPCYCTVHVEFLFVPAFRGAPAATICSGAPAAGSGAANRKRDPTSWTFVAPDGLAPELMDPGP